MLALLLLLLLLQLLLRQNGLTDLYLAQTASTIVGAQALVLQAMNASGAGRGSRLNEAAAAGAKDKKFLKKAFSKRMQRQVGGSVHLHSFCIYNIIKSYIKLQCCC
jgi:hypothetical protein